MKCDKCGKKDCAKCKSLSDATKGGYGGIKLMANKINEINKKRDAKK